MLLIVTAFLVLAVLVKYHRRIKTNEHRSDEHRSDTYDPQLGENGIPFADGDRRLSYEDPDDFSDKKNTSKASFRVRFEKREVCDILYFSIANCMLKYSLMHI